MKKLEEYDMTHRIYRNTLSQGKCKQMPNPVLWVLTTNHSPVQPKPNLGHKLLSWLAYRIWVRGYLQEHK